MTGLIIHRSFAALIITSREDFMAKKRIAIIACKNIKGFSFLIERNNAGTKND